LIIILFKTALIVYSFFLKIGILPFEYQLSTSPEDAFYEVAPRFADRKMNSTTLCSFNDPIRYRNISLTARVVIALTGLTIIRDLPGERGLRVAVSRSRAIVG
jgi:hypothetical protein